MVSVLRTLQSEWNELVPQAQALGIRRVRTLNLPLETIEYRRAKLDSLRAEITRLTRTVLLSSTLSSTAILPNLTFGVELEFVLPANYSHSGMAEELTRRADIFCRSEGYGHVTGPHWKIVTDGSLGNYAKGAELVSPVLRGEDGLRQVYRACEVLKRAGCRPSKKCGLHVHVGAGDWSVRTFRNLALLYASAEGAIDSFMAPSRRGPNGGNGFCKSLRINARLMNTAASVDQVALAMGQSPGRGNARGGSRYSKLNMQSFWQHGTVEFRHHQGTVEADKATNWIKLCLRMAHAASHEGFRLAVTFDELFEFVGATEDEKTFFQGRATFFDAQLNRSSAVRRHTLPAGVYASEVDHSQDGYEPTERTRRRMQREQEQYRLRTDESNSIDEALREAIEHANPRPIPLAGIRTPSALVPTRDQVFHFSGDTGGNYGAAREANPFDRVGDELTARSRTRG